MTNIKENITVPFELFNQYLESYNGLTAVETKPGNVTSVKTFTHKTSLYCFFGSIHSAFKPTSSSTLYAYKLILERLYKNETYECYHTPFELTPSKERDDLTGLIVKVKGEKYVCGIKVDIRQGIPSSRPISLQRAKNHIEKATFGYWSAEMDSPIQWKQHQNHPVAVFSSSNRTKKDHNILLSGDGKKIKELFIFGFKLKKLAQESDDYDSDLFNPFDQSVIESTEQQMSLF